MSELNSRCLTKSDVPDLTRFIGNELLGESYQRWDSRVKYYPTLTFIFIESEEKFQIRRLSDSTAIQRKVQIKTRVTKLENYDDVEQIPEEVINEYRSRCESLKGYTLN